MNVWLLLVLLVGGLGHGVRFDGFEGRRPIKYFFHLLELKADFNPLLYPATAAHPRLCSSKAGPFCALTRHPPLKTHELREMSPELQSFKQYLQGNVKQTYATYQSVERSESQMFLIRSPHVNSYESVLKKEMGGLGEEGMLGEAFELLW